MAKLTKRELFRLFFVAGSSLAIGSLLPLSCDVVKEYRRSLNIKTPIRVMSDLERMINNSPFPPNTQFLGLTMPWNYEFPQETTIEFPTASSDGSFIKRCNKFGLPDTDFSLDKPEGEVRIIITGDSNVLGHGIPNEDTFPQRLGEMFRQSNQRNIRVINAGKSLATIYHQSLKYEHMLSLMKPDILVVSVTLSNDILELLPYAMMDFFMVPMTYLKATDDGYEMRGPVIENNTKGVVMKGDSLIKRLSNQPFKPKGIDVNSFRSYLSEHETKMHEFSEGAFFQGGCQGFYLRALAKQGIWPELTQRIQYSFLDLKRTLETKKNPPQVYLLLLPSPYENPSIFISGEVRKISDYIDRQNLPQGPTFDEIRSSVIDAATDYGGIPKSNIIDPKPNLLKEEDCFNMSDFHFSPKGCKAIAEAIYKRLKKN